VASRLPRNDRSRSDAEPTSTTSPLETPATATSGPVAEQPIADEPWDEAWLPGWVNDADTPGMVTDAPIEDEPTDGALTDDVRPDEIVSDEIVSDEALPGVALPEELVADEALVPDPAAPHPVVPSAAEPAHGQDRDDEPAPLPEPLAEPADLVEPVSLDESADIDTPLTDAVDESALDAAERPDEGQYADPAPALAAPVRRPLPPRIDAALAELREAELAAQRAAEDQAAAQMAAWEEAIRAGEALADRTASSSATPEEPTATPPSAAAVEVDDVRSAPADGRRHYRVLLPLAVLLVAGLLAGFSFTAASTGDGAEVAASEREAATTSSPSPTPIRASPSRAGLPVDPLAGVVPVGTVTEQPTETAASTTARVRVRVTAGTTAAARSTSSAQAPAPGTPIVAAGPTAGPVPGADGTPSGGTGTDPAGVTGSDGTATDGTPTEDTPVDGTPIDGTPTDGSGDPVDPVDCPTGDDGTADTGGDTGDGSDEQLAGACEEDPDNGGSAGSTDDGGTGQTADQTPDQTPATTLAGRKG
jgi:hypothetical protein